jgi:hypothetical protein
MFQAILYGDETLYPQEVLIEVSRELKNELESKSYVSEVEIQ